MIGKKFGLLTVLERAGSRYGQAHWLCRCECGGQVIAGGSNLRKKQTRSCGCLNLRITADGIARILKKYQVGAERRKLSFDLSLERFTELIKKDCDYCGAVPNQTIRVGHRLSKFHPSFKYNGIDRVDTSKGYIEGNVVPCCGACNRAKARLSCGEFLRLVEAIYKHKIARAVSA